MLMYTVSFGLRYPSCVTIRNQCSNTKLASPVYFGNGATCPKLSSQQIDICAKTNAHFEINTIQDDFEGALLFKLQRYSNRQRNMNASTTETNKGEVAHVYMLAAWKVMDSKFFVCVVLIEHTKEFTWDESKLEKLYNKNRDWLKEYNNRNWLKEYNNRDWLKEYNDTTIVTWFMDNNIVLKTAFRVRGLKDNFRLSISIFEERGNDYDMKPIQINTER
jgi:hypothetical protein